MKRQSITITLGAEPSCPKIAQYQRLQTASIWILSEVFGDGRVSRSGHGHDFDAARGEFYEYKFVPDQKPTVHTVRILWPDSRDGEHTTCIVMDGERVRANYEVRFAAQADQVLAYA